MATHRRAKKFALLFAVVAMFVATASPVQAAGTFTDDDGNIHEADIEYIAALKITLGCNEAGTLYCPNDYVTREQMASFLVRAFKLPPSLVDGFPDDNGSIHEADINALKASGITTGCTLTLYCPKQFVSRQEMATFIVRALKLVTFTTPVFTDVTGLHLPDVNTLAGHKITIGCTATTFCPTNPVRRDEMAAFLARALRLGTARAPVVTITSPANLASFFTAFDLSFGRYVATIPVQATATDVNGGIAVFTWTSSVDGALGAGASRDVTLTVPPGQTGSQPTIVARATDAGGLFSLDSIQVKLVVPSP